MPDVVKVPVKRVLRSEKDVRVATKISNHDWSIDNKNRRKVLFMRTMAGTPTVLNRKQLKGNSNEISYAKNNFDFDSGNPAFRSKDTFYYGMDIERGQLSFGKAKDSLLPELRFKILKKGLVSQLVSGLDTKGLAGIIMYILLAGGAFGCLGYIIGNVLPIG
jgi:hypothetical protein